VVSDLGRIQSVRKMLVAMVENFRSPSDMKNRGSDACVPFARMEVFDRRDPYAAIAMCPM
jgi:hypothetical protein